MVDQRRCTHKDGDGKQCNASGRKRRDRQSRVLALTLLNLSANPAGLVTKIRTISTGSVAGELA
jgi:hypothetical protein